MTALSLAVHAKAAPRGAIAHALIALLVTAFVLLLSWRTPDGGHAGRA